MHRVLIADDDPEITGALAHRCRQMGLAVETAANSMETLRKLEMRPPDVAILDVNMPEGNGLAVCEMIAHHKELKNLPVIILTGKKDPNTVQRCHELRAYYVPKCADVWPRIGPLLNELLELPTPLPQNAELPAVKPAACDLQPSVNTPPDIMDAVFAALARDECDLVAERSSLVAKQPARPWVLCIDDDAAFSLGLQLRLQEHGVDVLRAFAGREGYRYAFHSQAQAIILDYQLPEGNGDYVLRRLKESPVTQNIPVIVLTGARDRHVERQMYSLGAASFMTKPYDWDDLWWELQRHLDFGGEGLRESQRSTASDRSPSFGRQPAIVPGLLQSLNAYA